MTRLRLPQHMALRFAALVLSVVFWFLAPRAGGPASLTSGQTVVLPVDIEGVAPGQWIAEAPGPAVLTLRGRGTLQAGDAASISLRAFVDIGGLGEGRHAVPIQWDGTDAHLVLESSPSLVWVEVEEALQRTFTVEVWPIGDGANAYAVDPVDARVRGPRGDVEQVRRIVAPVLPGAAEQVGLWAMDAQGRPVRGVQVEPATVRVSEDAPGDT